MAYTYICLHAGLSTLNKNCSGWQLHTLDCRVCWPPLALHEWLWLAFSSQWARLGCMDAAKLVNCNHACKWSGVNVVSYRQCTEDMAIEAQLCIISAYRRERTRNGAFLTHLIAKSCPIFNLASTSIYLNIVRQFDNLVAQCRCDAKCGCYHTGWARSHAVIVPPSCIRVHDEHVGIIDHLA